MIELSDKDFWRFLILYGKNQSTYKMALGNSLIRYAKTNSDKKIHLDDLARDFFDIYQKRLENGKPQMMTLGRKTVVETALDEVKVGKTTTENALENIKVNALKNMVLQKFHTLNTKKIPRPFYHLSDDERYLHLNDNLFNIFADNQNKELSDELESRWSLLEHGFSDARKGESLEVDEELEYVRNKQQRTNLTRLIPVLQGYQQNLCFYCGQELYSPIHVDHVIPYQAIKHNEIWNLVLAHEFCNEDKTDNIPPRHFIESLISRNEFVLKSDLPLREELKKNLGKTEEERRAKVEKEYDFAKRKIVRIWRGSESFDPNRIESYKKLVNALGIL